MEDLETIDDNEEVIRTLMLEYEDGSEVECMIRAILEIEGKMYVALLPMGEEEYQVFGFVEHGEEVEILNIEDDDEYERVIEAFDEYFFNEEEFEEEEDDDSDEENDEDEE